MDKSETAKFLYYDQNAKGDGSGCDWKNALTNQDQVRKKFKPGDTLYLANHSDFDLGAFCRGEA